MYTLDDLQQNKIADLKEIATKLNLKKFQKLNKTDLIYKILDEQATVSSKEVTEKKEENSDPKKKRERFVKKPKNNSEEKTTENVENKTTKKEENIKKETPGKSLLFEKK